MGNEIITKNIAEIAEEYMKIYGANKNLYRHIPSLVDGLKPVHRRTLYTMYKDFPLNSFTKVQRIMGNTLAYHPHGDSAIHEVIGGMGKPWDNNVCLIKGSGNYGSPADPEIGAPRYIEARLSDFSKKAYFEDFENAIVDMKENYDGTTKEPEFLPAKYPVILFNGSFSSIGYGAASNIPPYNVKEVCEAVIKRIKNPKAKIYFVPDAPAGASVVDTEKLREGFYNGIGSVTFQSDFNIDHVNNIISITTLAPQVTTNKITDELVKMKLAGKLDEVVNFKDHTGDKNGILLELFLKSDANPDEVIKKLYKSKCGFRKTLPIGIMVIDNYTSYDYNIPQLIDAWINYRRENLRSSFIKKNVVLKEERVMNDIKLFVFSKDNSEKTMEICKKSKDTDEAILKLMKEYNIDSIQAKTIYNMGFKNFTKEAYQGFKKRKDELDEEILHVEYILSDHKHIDEEIIRELEEGIKLFGRPRQSRIISIDESEGCATEHLVGISEDGYIKKVNKSDVVVGKISKQSGIKTMNIPCLNTENLLIFDNTGKISRLAVKDLPLSNQFEQGLLLSRYVKIPGKRIVSVLVEPKASVIKDNKISIILVTSKGIVKKTSLLEFLKMKGASTAINMDDGNELVSVLTTVEDTTKDIILYTNLGDGVRIDINEIKSFSKSAKGSSIIKLRPSEVISGASKIEPKKDYLFYITNTGKVKLTDLKFFPVMKLKEEPLPLISLDKNEELVGIACW